MLIHASFVHQFTDIFVDLDDSFLVGSELLVKPVVEADQTTARVYLPGTNVVWYDYITSKV